MELYYINKKDKRINITITFHAKKRFIERHNRIFPDESIFDLELVDLAIEKWWKLAKLRNSKSKRVKTRNDKYGSDTLYFVSDHFVFVVQNSSIVTIELGSKSTRHLNSRKGPSPLKDKRKINKRLLTLTESIKEKEIEDEVNKPKNKYIIIKNEYKIDRTHFLDKLSNVKG